MADSACADMALSLLQKHWGYESFRKAQSVVIDAAISGEDVLAVLPTGYGKSACFQIPALMADGVSIVISPLIALMKDQVDDCAKRGIAASFVNSHVEEGEQEDRFQNLVDGLYKVFYIAPERIRSKAFVAALKNTNVSYLVVDEAHCASRWGHDFRPSYMNIHRILDVLKRARRPRPTIMAVTATATQDIEDDIAQSVGMSEEYVRVVGDPVRPNLQYDVVTYGNPWSTFRREVRKFDPENGRYVVYSGTRNGAEKLASIAREELDLGPTDVGFYHAGMKKNEREAVQDAFKSGKTPIVVATNAFGMGIDVPNIRAVIHFGIPGSLEDYCQEAGRAGRDGEPARVVLIDEDFSRELRQRFLNGANPSYDYFEKVWDYLNSFPADYVHRMSATDFAKAMKLDPDKDSQAIGGALNTMEAYGAVLRGYAQSGTAIIVDVDQFYTLTQGAKKLKPVTSRVVSAIWDAFLSSAQVGNGALITIHLSKTEFATKVGLSAYALNKTLKALEDRDYLELSTTFTGKTTQVVGEHYEANLEDVIDKDAIIAKRNREQVRLNKMLDYSNSGNRKQYIRDYFLGTKED